ncbi:MAG: hypothetical protein CSA07_04490 [Bacteroidia bacterium]|nr:MAG: hypothetical protein CSA07_04490 [Bacteroidia bacterium]
MAKQVNESATGKIPTVKLLKFLIPSLVGILLLMTPFHDGEGTTVGVAVMSKFINSSINALVPIHWLVLVCIVASCVLTTVYKVSKPAFIENSPLLKELSDVSVFWYIARLAGLVVGVMVAFKLGPAIVFDGNTGGLILFDLIGGLFTIFLIAGFILPFLTEFGLLEFVGVFMSKVMRPVFGLPGRSAVDCLASWIGDGTIGVALTNKQFEDGYYTEREASVISTTFSAVSITFCLVVVSNVQLTDMFAQFYLTVGVAGVVAALIVPRIPPLSMKKDIRMRDDAGASTEVTPEGYTMPGWALKLATDRAEQSSGLGNFLSKGLRTVLGLWIGVIPIIMVAGTMALVLSEATPIFTWLGMPFLPILNLLQVPEAQAASETMVVGFADMVVPSILAEANITSPMTRFIVACVSVTQLIYMSETGAVLLGSNLPVNLFDIFVIFLERTLVTLPVIVLMAHLFF